MKLTQLEINICQTDSLTREKPHNCRMAEKSRKHKIKKDIVTRTERPDQAKSESSLLAFRPLFIPGLLSLIYNKYIHIT